MRAVWLMVVAVLVLAGCTSRTEGAPAKDDSPVVGPVSLVVPIEMRPVLEQTGPSGSPAPPATAPPLTTTALPLPPGPSDLPTTSGAPTTSEAPTTSGTAPPSASAVPSGTVLPDPSGEMLTLADPIMVVERLDHAEVTRDEVSTTWTLMLDLTDEDAATFADWTADHIGERLAMVIDGEVVIAPTIQAAITGGSVQIAGDYTESEIRDLLDKITGR